jgi:hypothetical protein
MIHRLYIISRGCENTQQRKCKNRYNKNIKNFFCLLCHVAAYFQRRCTWYMYVCMYVYVYVYVCVCVYNCILCVQIAAQHGQQKFRIKTEDDESSAAGRVNPEQTSSARQSRTDIVFKPSLANKSLKFLFTELTSVGPPALPGPFYLTQLVTEE